MMKSEDIINYLRITEGGFKEPSNTFFENKNYFPKYLKKGVLTVEEEDDHPTKHQQIYCNIAGCGSSFQSVSAYQSHYNSLHRYICSQCKKSLPTPHLLDLHLSENHDSYFAVLSQNKPMFQCYIEECTHKSSTPEERKDHCISVHKYPQNFRFENLCTIGNNGRKQLPIIDEPMDGVKPKLFKNNTNFSFGHAKEKTFNKKSYGKLLSKTEVEYKNTLEDSKTVNDLLNSLPK
ncbi:zinc finger protein 511 [Episyrphus balteatus]|uniref:zinc finger protein 511 n=1 Tax=Episyrphus balteatus TaxID=286459 RepID=UPI0024869210|nr:zinc finger protein 511 [Episyrphus balteatus]